MRNLKSVLWLVSLMTIALLLEWIHSTVILRGIGQVYIAMLFNIALDLAFVAALFGTMLIALSGKLSPPVSAFLAILSGLILFSPIIVFLLSLTGIGFPVHLIPIAKPGSYMSLASAAVLLISLFKGTNKSRELAQNTG